MSPWLRVLSCVAPTTHWHWTCPHDVDTIADDFVKNHLPLDKPQFWLLDFDNITDGDPWFAWHRRIAYVYGVASTYQDLRGKNAAPAWNRRLWSQHEDADPEELVHTIFIGVIERLQSIKASANSREN